MVSLRDQQPQANDDPLAEVKSIADHQKFRFRGAYITVVGRGRRSRVWEQGADGVGVNLNVYMDLLFSCKDEARRWAKWYAGENELPYFETKGHGKIKF